MRPRVTRLGHRPLTDELLASARAHCLPHEETPMVGAATQSLATEVSHNAVGHVEVEGVTWRTGWPSAIGVRGVRALQGWACVSAASMKTAISCRKSCQMKQRLRPAKELNAVGTQV